MSLNNEPYMTRPTLIYLNTIETNYYPFAIRLGKCNGGCNDVDDLSTKIFFLSQTKDVNVKYINVKTRKK